MKHLICKMPLIRGTLFITVLSFIIFAISVMAIAQETTKDTINEALSKTSADLKEQIGSLPASTLQSTKAIDSLIDEVTGSFAFAEKALAEGNLALAIDSLQLSRGLVNSAFSQIPIPSTTLTSGEQGRVLARNLQSDTLSDAGISQIDMENVNDFLDQMTTHEAKLSAEVGDVMSRLNAGGFNIAKLGETLDQVGLEKGDITRSISFDLKNLSSLSSSLRDAISRAGGIGEVSRAAGQALAQMGATLQQVADAVSIAIKSGVNVDLESLAQGAGYSSFSAAVEAYKAANGTSYTDAQAKEALGQ